MTFQRISFGEKRGQHGRERKDSGGTAEIKGGKLQINIKKTAKTIVTLNIY